MFPSSPKSVVRELQVPSIRCMDQDKLQHGVLLLLVMGNNMNGARVYRGSVFYGKFRVKNAKGKRLGDKRGNYRGVENNKKGLSECFACAL